MMIMKIDFSSILLVSGIFGIIVFAVYIFYDGYQDQCELEQNALQYESKIDGSSYKCFEYRGKLFIINKDTNDYAYIGTVNWQHKNDE
jgi:hypothetical protein